MAKEAFNRHADRSAHDHYQEVTRCTPETQRKIKKTEERADQLKEQKRKLQAKQRPIKVVRELNRLTNQPRNEPGPVIPRQRHRQAEMNVDQRNAKALKRIEQTKNRQIEKLKEKDRQQRERGSQGRSRNDRGRDDGRGRH